MPYRAMSTNVADEAKKTNNKPGKNDSTLKSTLRESREMSVKIDRKYYLKKKNKPNEEEDEKEREKESNTD